jgi:hypothetical protein
MRFAHGSRVVLLQDVRLTGGAVVEPAGARGVVKRDTGSIVIVAFEDGRTMPVTSEKLGTDSNSEGSPAS